jgi:hypothetical protein
VKGFATISSVVFFSILFQSAYESVLMSPTLDKSCAYGLSGALLNEYVNWSLTLLRSRQHAHIAIQLITATMYAMAANLFAALRHYSYTRG